jgi:hypothetical protein
LAWLLPDIFGIPLELIIIVVAAVCIAVAIAYRRGKRAPARKAPAPVAAPLKVEKAAPAPVEKLDEDLVRLKVEKTATESALKSLEDAVKEGAITKETFEKHKATYAERLRKIDSELSKRPKTDVAKLESEVDRVRKSYLDKLKDLSKKAVMARPAAPATVTAAKATAAPARAAPPRAPTPSVRLPEVPPARKVEQFELTPPPARVPPVVPTIPEAPAESAVSAAPKVSPGGQASIADLRREMMDELNRLKRLIGRAEA